MNKDKINKITYITDKEFSPTFCFAKWYHTTIYLQLGHTHSCYHPMPHKIPLEELKNNPSALHNTNHKKQERKEMLEGKQCVGCQYCWNIENMGEGHISDRHIRSSSIYNLQRLNEVKENPWDFNVNPTYIEISFGNECNFKCGYCHPKYSSRYHQEVKKHGPVTTVKNHRGDVDYFKLYEREEENPYVDAWWEWWPEISKTLEILRITGGEPILHKSTWRLFKELKTRPLSKLELNINSNFGMKQSMVQILSNEVNYLIDNNCIKNFRLFTSIDTWGPKAEYMRTGLDIDLWKQNMDNYIKTTKQPLSIMVTFNNLAVSSFKSLLEKILEWREEYNVYLKDNPNVLQMISFDTPYLKEPLQYDINILPKDEYMPYMHECLTFIEENMDDKDKSKFHSLEYEKFKRVVDYMENTQYSEAKLSEGRRDFYNWFNAMDERRNTNFLETFPEMQDFYDLCKKEHMLRKDLDIRVI